MACRHCTRPECAVRRPYHSRTFILPELKKDWVQKVGALSFRLKANLSLYSCLGRIQSSTGWSYMLWIAALSLRELRDLVIKIFLRLCWCFLCVSGFARPECLSRYEVFRVLLSGFRPLTFISYLVCRISGAPLPLPVRPSWWKTWVYDPYRRIASLVNTLFSVLQYTPRNVRHLLVNSSRSLSGYWPRHSLHSLNAQRTMRTGGENVMEVDTYILNPGRTDTPTANNSSGGRKPSVSKPS